MDVSPSHSRFVAELKADARAYFGSLHRPVRGDPRMWRRGFLVLVVAIASYALLLGPWLPVAWKALPAVVFGVFYALIGMCIGHDALHGTMHPNARVNRVLGWAHDFIGGSSYVWRLTHNRTHHVFTNVEGVDVDIDFGGVLRTSPGTLRRPWHRFQAWYAIPLYALVAIKWHYLTDFGFMMRPRIGTLDTSRHSWRGWASVALCKLWTVAFTIVIPVWVARPTALQFFAGYFLVLATAGLTLATTFQLAHAVEEVAFTELGPDGLPEPFAVHQLRTTANFACDNKVVGYFLAGLNFQVEHHLFPQVASIHYPALRPIVKRLAQRHGLPYLEAPSVLGALRSHLRHLDAMGRA